MTGNKEAEALEETGYIRKRTKHALFLLEVMFCGLNMQVTRAAFCAGRPISRPSRVNARRQRVCRMICFARISINTSKTALSTHSKLLSVLSSE